MSKTLEYDCSMCGVHLICNGEGIPELKICWSCKEKYGFLRNMIHNYIKENLRISARRPACSYGYGGDSVDIELLLDGETISSESFDV